MKLQVKDTSPPPEKQPKKPIYGRLFMRNQPVYTRLSPLAFKVYGIACLYAYREIEPYGYVPMSLRALSRLVGSPHRSVLRALPQLVDERLINYENGTITIVSYLEEWCHEDTRVVTTRHQGGDTRTPGVVSSGHHKSLQPQVDKGVPGPPEEEPDVYQKIPQEVAAGNGAQKKSRRRPSWLIWNEEEERLESRGGVEFKEKRDEFVKTWTERLGNQEQIYDQLDEAEKWLKEYPDRRGKVKRFDMFFGKWLDRCLEG